MSLIPKNLLSRFVGRLVRIQWPHPLNLFLLRHFARRYKINLDEAEHPLSSYLTIQDLFTRRLKPGLRPVSSAEVVHPVDGMLTVVQHIRRGLLLQAKGFNYQLDEFIGERGPAWEGGVQLTYYLCPTDYHRVHAPVAGEIIKVRYIPGELWPVNDWSVTSVRQLFQRNERVVVHIQTPKGVVILVMVGATNVGQMTLSFDSEIISNQGRQGGEKTYSPSLALLKGGELGVFNMGSTVIMLYPPGFVADGPPDRPRHVQMGQSL